MALAACMRNEGPFVLEWVAYHRLIGFDPVIVVTNDVTDGSDALLDRLAQLDAVTHLRQTVPPGAAPQDAGMDHVLALCRDQGIPFVMHLDSDEFLAILQDDLAEILRRVEGLGADVVAVPWRAFGDSGLRDWTPGDLVLERNTRAEPAPEPGVAKFKSLFRVASFGGASDHMPRAPQVPDPLVIRPDGKALRNAPLFWPETTSRYRPHGTATASARAQVYHYALRAEDVFLMKNDRGNGQGKTGDTKYHLGSRWHRLANRNDVEETRMLSLVPQIRAQIAAWRADPALAACERACHDWFLARKAAVLTPAQRAAWTRKAPA
ncbi:hypothetical protein AVJ23_02815 [Pseudoponticoccus marisrubri]|uniref:Glycosyl transferase family 2 n=1 Tax=Pseudoponticoccus marisrubri TaxID=1685382 RepID=A0A0W7WPZ3_9RHOB|nr:hypothetical protein AVJ23_02815 [Pseudoponticoccus marisrubri]